MNLLVYVHEAVSQPAIILAEEYLTTLPLHLFAVI